VHFLGRIGTDDLPHYYRHAIALIVPSVGFETFGIILIEAFRQATPVIARRMGPFPEIVDLAQGGELFSNSEELVVAMRRLQADSDRRTALGRNGYEAYLRHWTEGAVVPRYLRAVREAAARRDLTHIVDALDEEALEAPARARRLRPLAGSRAVGPEATR
jgi:glycosyltransferase involved in cell wall biosynthesis